MLKTTKRPDAILYLSDARGIYIPRDFAADTRREYIYIAGVAAEALDTLALGPPGGMDSKEGASEAYWDIWSDVCDRARVTSPEYPGFEFTLYQDGDLWLIPRGMESDDGGAWHPAVTVVYQRPTDAAIALRSDRDDHADPCPTCGKDRSTMEPAIRSFHPGSC